MIIFSCMVGGGWGGWGGWTLKMLSLSPPTPPCSSLHSLSADKLGDIWEFDPATMAWTLLSATANSVRPSARHYHGFTSAEGKLFVHGGSGSNGM